MQATDRRPEAILVAMGDHPAWSPLEMTHIYTRLLLGDLDYRNRAAVRAHLRRRLLEGELTPRMAEHYGRKLHHWGSLALEARDAGLWGWLRQRWGGAR